jgi:hypothetical protein
VPLPPALLSALSTIQAGNVTWVEGRNSDASAGG